MLTSRFSKHLFWSYQENADLPEEIVIKCVLAYGEITDLLTLNELIPENRVKEVLKNWKDREKFIKRINFYNKVICQV